jgi:hypothetical protein
VEALTMSDIEERLDRLESLVEQQRNRIDEQQRTIQRQQATIATQRERIADLEREASRDAPEDDGDPALVDRRDALKAGGLLALLFGGVGTASADPQGQVGTSSDPLQALYTNTLHGNSGTLTIGDTLDLDRNSLQDGSTIIWDSASGADLDSDTAKTFGESELTVDHSGTTTDAEAIDLPGESVVSRNSDEFQSSGTKSYGIQIEMNQPANAITVRISDQTTGGDTVALKDNNGNTLTTAGFPGSGGSVTLDYSLSAGSRYVLEVDDSATHGYRTVTFPYTSTSFDVLTTTINGVPQDGAFDTSFYSFDRISVPASTAGTATVEWTTPDSVSRWETAAFQADEDGETVEVYVETDDGNGWSDWRTDPIAPGTDISSIPSDNRVRLRVELARENIENQPRVTLLERQWRP